MALGGLAGNGGDLYGRRGAAGGGEFVDFRAPLGCAPIPR
jgi:hypothetical protein